MGGVEIVSHTVEHEVVEAVAGPGIVSAERFEDEERFAKCGAMLEGTVESEIEMKAAGGNHPVKDVTAFGKQRRAIAGANANGGDFVHEAYLEFPRGKCTRVQARWRIAARGLTFFVERDSLPSELRRIRSRGCE